MSSTRKITLKSSDGGIFEIDETAALELQTIKNMLKDNCADTGIPIPNVTGKILTKVIEYCKKHVEVASSEQEKPRNEDDLKAWDSEFINVDLHTLFELLLAANYLKNKNLVDLTCQTISDMFKGKTSEEIRKLLNIKNDFTPEEEEEIRWAYLLCFS